MPNIDTQESMKSLPDTALDMHKAIISLVEELQAIDSYNQRVAICKDTELNAILVHNRDEEKEHASMLLEWIQRNDSKFSNELKNQLFTNQKIARH